MLISFSLLGIGNALMQTSLNPLLSNVVSGERLASSLTFGQFVKAIASFLAPYIAMWGLQAIPSLRDGLASAVSHLYGDSGCRYPVAGALHLFMRKRKKGVLLLSANVLLCWESRSYCFVSWALCAMWVSM